MSSHRLTVRFALAASFSGLGLFGCESSTGPDLHRDFIVDVNGERFIMRAIDPTTIQQAVNILNREENLFPIGPLRSGNGGFNTPWSWHMDPAEVRLTEVSVEVCDAMPSFVEENLNNFLRPEVGYCPWSARIVGEK